MSLSKVLWVCLNTALFVVLFYATLLPIPLVRARNIVVPVDYPDIQTALDNAVDGDVITVMNGVYSGFEVRKSVTVIGESSQAVTVKGVVVVRSSGVRLSSMRILLEDTTSGFASAVAVYGSDVLLSNLVVESDSSGIQIGDPNYTNSSVSIEYVTIVAGRKGDYLGKPAGVWGVCKSLYIYYSNITLMREGTGVAGCGYMQLVYSYVNSKDTGVRIGSGEISSSDILGSQTGLVISGGNVVVESNNVKSNGIGIDILQSSRNTITGNNVVGSGTGVRLVGKENTISSNRISSSGSAIELRGDNNLITNNTLSGGRGVNGLYAYRNTISFNFINMTGSIGVYMSSSTGGNTIYGNTFWYCYNYNAADESGENQWYLESDSLKIGNYWYDHTSPDNNGDGIVDVPYEIATTTSKRILDKYPLTYPVVGVTWGTTTTSINTPGSTHTYTTSLIETDSQQSTPESVEKASNYLNYLIIAIFIVIFVVIVVLIMVLRGKQ